MNKANTLYSKTHLYIYPYIPTQTLTKTKDIYQNVNYDDYQVVPS